MKPHPLHKIGLVAKEVEESVRFFTCIFGMRLVERFPVEGDEDFVFLQSGDLLLELMPARTMGKPPGLHHISFASEDLGESLEQMRRAGMEIAREPFAVGVGGIRLAFLNGPEGLNLPLFERKEGED